MGVVVSLVDRPIYGMGQVDRVLGLSSGTARRWIDGYQRAGRHYPPVVREQPTGSDVVTWGEFVEARLLAEFRDRGVPLARMRPVVMALREELNTPYPLTSARAWLDNDGRELIRRIQDEVGLDSQLRIVVVRSGQYGLDWSEPARQFERAAEWADTSNGREIVRLRPGPTTTDVTIDPLRSFGEPTVRGVRTDIISELYLSGETVDGIAESYELSPHQVEDALRYELSRVKAA